MRDALGVLYVLEGSALGGAVIGRMVARDLGLTSAFFAAAAGSRARWRAFGAHVERHAPVSPQAAVATFEDMEVWLCRVNDELLEPGTPVDLENCHREPIRTPGGIQSHGALLAADEHDARGRPGLGQRRRPCSARAVLGTSLDRAAGGSEVVEQLRAGAADATPNLRPLRIHGLDAYAYRVADGVLVVELEPVGADAARASRATRARSRGRSTLLQDAPTIDELLRRAAHVVRELDGLGPRVGLPLRARRPRRDRRPRRSARTSTRSSACTIRPATSRRRRARCSSRTGCGSSTTWRRRPRRSSRS